MDTRDGIIEAIGNTPLIRLRAASEATGCDIFGKAEFMNPGMSVKDRAALFMIEDAERRGALKPGGCIVEGTAGNTGIGLALVGRAKGYRTVIVIPETQSQEKKDMLTLAGAELVQVPAKPFADPNNYVKVAERLAAHIDEAEPGGAFYANQWDNLANRQAHIDGTAPEIWRQTGCRIDGFICAMGTGGTLSGTGLKLKELSEGRVRIGLADPAGAKMFHYFTEGKLVANPGGSITQGIGQGRVTGNVDGAKVDHAYFIPDEEAVEICFGLAESEGLVLGGSSGINVAGAIRLARELGPGHTIVTILCDPGNRYQSQMWNPAFLRSQGFRVPAWLEPAAPRDLGGIFQADPGTQG
ncbi:MAG: cysteine synthase A [Myxococcota bacterium]